jgi:hypothetical protein
MTFTSSDCWKGYAPGDIVRILDTGDPNDPSQPAVGWRLMRIEHIEGHSAEMVAATRMEWFKHRMSRAWKSVLGES